LRCQPGVSPQLPADPEHCTLCSPPGRRSSAGDSASEVSGGQAGSAPQLMTGSPPPSGRLLTLENWPAAPFNRREFTHIQDLMPPRITRGPELAARLDQDRPRTVTASSSLAQAGQMWTVVPMLQGTFTGGFLVLHNGRVVAEQHDGGLTSSTRHWQREPGHLRVCCRTDGRDLPGTGRPPGWHRDNRPARRLRPCANRLRAGLAGAFWRAWPQILLSIVQGSWPSAPIDCRQNVPVTWVASNSAAAYRTSPGARKFGSGSRPR
jgi:hypothetical protein